MVAGFAAIRTFITLGWAVSLIALSAVHPAAAGPILVKQSAATPDLELVIGLITKRGITDHNEQTQPAIVDNLGLEFDTGHNPGSAGVPRQTASLTAALGLTSSAPSSQFASMERGTNGDDDASAHDIAVDLYHTIYDINSGVAADLLTSYRIIGRVHADIIAAIKAPLDTIGLSNDSATPQVDFAGPASSDTNDRYDAVDHISVDQIIKRIRFLFSLDALPYYIIISTLYVALAALRAAFRTLSRRSR